MKKFIALMFFSITFLTQISFAQAGLNKLDSLKTVVFVEDSTGFWQIGPGKIFNLEVFYLKNTEDSKLDITFIKSKTGFTLNSGDVLLADRLLANIKADSGNVGLSLLSSVTKQFFVSVNNAMWQVTPKNIYGMEIVEFEDLSRKKIINFIIDRNKFWSINQNQGVEIHEIIKVLNEAKTKGDLK